MKKIIAICLILTIIWLSACAKNSQSSQGDKSLTAGLSNSVITAPNDSYITNITPADLIGCWNASPYWAAGRGDNHNFYADGHYRFGFNEMDDLKRIWYRDGTWKIVDGQVQISITSQTYCNGGKFVFDRAYGYSIEGGSLVVDAIDPPWVENYDSSELQIHYDFNVHDELYRDDQGKYLTAHFGNKQFWKLNDIPPRINEVGITE